MAILTVGDLPLLQAHTLTRPCTPTALRTPSPPLTPWLPPPQELAEHAQP